MNFFIPIVSVLAITVLRCSELATKRDVIAGRVFEKTTLRLLIINGFVVLFAALLEYVLRDGTLTPLPYAIGVACGVASFVLRRRAIAALGRFWSLHVEMRETHQLVKEGPFRWVRHPAYLSIAEMTQMLLNLMINALQSNGQIQGVLVEAKQIDAPLDISSLKAGPGNVFLHEDVFENRPPFVGITVSDRSGGISSDIVEEIFEPYFTTKPRDKGTGLGLSMVSRLLKSRSGALHLTTVLGSGSSFTIFLPLVPNG